MQSLPCLTLQTVYLRGLEEAMQHYFSLGVAAAVEIALH